MDCVKKISENTAKIETPFRWLIIGPSMSGKSSMARTIIMQQSNLFRNGKCKKTFYFTKEHQKEIEKLKSNGLIDEIFYALPQTEERFKELAYPYIGKQNETGFEENGTLFIFDDFGQELPRVISSIFCVLSHHLNANIILLLQTLYSKNPIYREISLNASQITLFKNLRDRSQIKTFSRQICEGKCDWIQKLFSDLSKFPYSYLHYDLSHSCPDELRIRSHIFSHEGFTRVYTEDKV